MMMRQAAAVAVFLSLAAVTASAGPATAKSPRAQAKAEVQKGQLDYQLGRFEQALEEYSHAYELFPAPALLFNLGQCHRNLKNYERAIFFFEGYLREQTKIEADQRALTEDLIAECKAAQETETKAMIKYNGWGSWTTLFEPSASSILNTK